MSDSINMARVLDFLRDLEKHNERSWFDAHRTAYDAARGEFELLVNTLIGELSVVGNLAGLTAKDCMLRIYRDMRFSKDKSPYRNSMAAQMASGGRKSGKRGWYVHIQPRGESIIGGGLYQPEPPALARFRQSIDEDPREFRGIIGAAGFKKYFGAVEGDAVKVAPQGYPKDHPDIDLLRQKDVIAIHHLSDDAVLAPDFPAHTVKVCKAMKPFLDYFNGLNL